MKHLYKLVDKQIDDCTDCVYCNYNSDYNRSYDSGYDCMKANYSGKRIINDHALDLDNITIPIPHWCPLPDSDEETKNDGK